MVVNGIDITPIIDALIGLLAVVIVVMKGPVAEYLKQKASLLNTQQSGEQNYLMETLAREGIKLASRLGGSNAEMKQLAVNFVDRQLTELGLTVSPESIDVLIEAVFTSVKEEKNGM